MAAGAQAPNLAQLREYLRARAPRVDRIAGRAIATGDEALDRLLDGGFPKGAITVVSGVAGAGRMTLAAKLIAHETRSGKPVAWVDAKSTVYPPALAQAGVDLTKVLMVRGAKDRSLYAAEQIASAGAFEVLIASGVDTWLTPVKLRRLQTATEGTGIASILLLDHLTSTAITNAAMKLRLSRKSSGLHLELEKHPTAMPGKRLLLQD